MELIQHRFQAMGTEITVTLIAELAQLDHAATAFASLQADFEVFGRDGWAWGDGALGDFNRALARGEAAWLPPALHSLMARAWLRREATGGLYEPRIATLVRLWGFDCMEHLREEPPPAAQIEAALAALAAAPPYDGGASYGPAPGVGWDLGGIGKGEIIDRGLELLSAFGFKDAMIDAGGNLAVRGRRPDRAWRVGIRDPRSDGQRLLLAIDLGDEAVITHGDDQRYFEYGGRRYAHLLDPRTGWPGRGLQSLTVIDSDAARADADGAALYVAGPNDWPELAQTLDLRQVVAVDEAGVIWLTPAIAARVQLCTDAPVRVLGS